jgi:hypothetical protein
MEVALARQKLVVVVALDIYKEVFEHFDKQFSIQNPTMIWCFIL